MEPNKLLPIKVSSSCVGCGQCVIQCPTRCIIIKKSNRVYIAPQNCPLCGHCFSICKVGAITMFNIKPEDEEVDLNRLDLVTNIVRFRRSIRKYKKEPIDSPIISSLLQYLSNMQTTFGNTPIKCIIVSRQVLLSIGERLADAHKERYTKLPMQQKQLDIIFRGAPHAIIFAAEVTPALLLNYQHLRDEAIAMATQFELLAQSKGFGTFWMGLMSAKINELDDVKQKVGLSPQDIVFATMGIGNPGIKYLRAAPRIPFHVDFLD